MINSRCRLGVLSFGVFSAYNKLFMEFQHVWVVETPHGASAVWKSVTKKTLDEYGIAENMKLKSISGHQILIAGRQRTEQKHFQTAS